MSNLQNDTINEDRAEAYADLNDELSTKAKAIIERYNLCQYTSAGDAILDGVQLGLEMSQKIFKAPWTPEEDNMYQGTINN